MLTEESNTGSSPGNRDGQPGSDIGISMKLNCLNLNVSNMSQHNGGAGAESMEMAL